MTTTAEEKKWTYSIDDKVFLVHKGSDPPFIEVRDVESAKIIRDNFNHRDILDYKLACLLDHATGSTMSYTHYTFEEMRDCVTRHVMSVSETRAEEYHSEKLREAEERCELPELSKDWGIPTNERIAEAAENNYRPVANYGNQLNLSAPQMLEKQEAFCKGSRWAIGRMLNEFFPTHQKNIEKQNAQLQAENEVLKSFIQWGESWTLVESLPLLIKATEKLLKQHSYDGGDYEEMMQAVECSKKALASLPEEKGEVGVCSWCGEQILVRQPTSKSYDGEVMHFGCADEADEADIGDCSC